MRTTLLIEVEIECGDSVCGNCNKRTYMGAMGLADPVGEDRNASYCTQFRTKLLTYNGQICRCADCHEAEDVHVFVINNR